MDNIPVSHWDIIIIGGGAIGLSAAYQASKAGKRVLVLEKYEYFNQSGSSGDYVRFFRTTYTEEFLAKLAVAAKKDWEELENDAGTQLIQMSGLLNFGDPQVDQGPEGTLLDPINVMENLRQNYEVLNNQQIMQRYPFKDLPSHYVGMFAPFNGCINVPLTLRSLYQLASKHGAALHSNEDVVKVTMENDGKVLVETTVTSMEPSLSRSYRADKIIITCGAYTNDVTKHFGFEIDLTIWEMASAYFTVDTTQYPVSQFQSMWFHFENNNMVYGFPEVPWGPKGHVRIAVDEATVQLENPKDRTLAPAEPDLKKTSEFVRKHIKGVNPTPTFMGTCLMANTFDNQFVLDFAPESYVGKFHKNIAVYTAGWAFKFAPLIGKMLVDLVSDKAETQYEEVRTQYFSITRDRILKKKDEVRPAFAYKSQFVRPKAEKPLKATPVEKSLKAMPMSIPKAVKIDRNFIPKVASVIKPLANSLIMDTLRFTRGVEDAETKNDAVKFAVKTERYLKSIYGEDSRVSVIPDEWKVTSTSVVSLWSSAQVTAVDGGHVLIAEPHISQKVNKKWLPLDENERFFGEPSGAFGSGFLVNDVDGKPTIIVTAGHCVVDERGASADNIKFVFGFDESVINKRTVRVTNDDVYEGKLVSYRLNGDTGEDWAVVKLNREVASKWAPAPIASELPKDKDALFVLGHPSGLTLKFATGQVQSTYNDIYIKTNLDTFAGNSGSPVFNDQKQIVGILVRGNEDYKWDDEKRKVVSVVYKENQGGEDVTRITVKPLRALFK